MTRASGYAISSISIVCFLLLWHFGTKAAGIPPYLLPGPIDVAKSAWVLYSSGLIFPHIGITLTQMLLGYFLGCVIAFVLGAIVAEFVLAERIVFPYVVGFQSMPKVALAPLLLVWFGFGMAFKVVLVALICFFPMFINTMTGLRSANPDLVDLYRAFSASRWLIFWDVKLPSAANSIFAGLQISVVLGLIGTVVGEFLAARQGLGHLIQSSSMNFDVGAMFTAVFTLSLIGVVSNFVVRSIYRKVVYWEKATPAAPISGH